MSLGTPKSGNAGGGGVHGGGDRGAALLGDLGFRSFPWDHSVSAGSGHGHGEDGAASLGALGFGSFAPFDPQGHSGGGGGDGAALVGSLRSFPPRDPRGYSGAGCGAGKGNGGDGGLGSFARLDLPAPSDGFDLNAAVALPLGEVAPALACSSHFSMQQIRACLPTVDKAFFDAERTLRDTQAEIQQLMTEKIQKESQIRSIVEDVKQELQGRHIKLKQLEHDKEVMRRILQGYSQMIKKSSDAFIEYRKMCEGSGASSSGVMADEQNRIILMQKWCAQNINRVQIYLLSKFKECAEEIIVLATSIADLNSEVQRLNVSIPDLNDGNPQL